MAANSELIFDVIWERMKLLTGWKVPADLTAYLQISQQSTSAAKQKGKMPIEWLLRVSAGFNGSIDWLLTGVGSMRRGDATPSTQTHGQLKPSTTDDLQSAPYAAFDALEVVEGMGMLTRIYSSGDTTYIRAINANLMAFSASWPSATPSP